MNITPLRFLSFFELLEAVLSIDRGRLFICGCVDFDNKTVVLYTGSLHKVVTKFSDYEPNAMVSPDFKRFSLVDNGLTVKLGDYEASNHSVFKMNSTSSS